MPRESVESHSESASGLFQPGVRGRVAAPLRENEAVDVDEAEAARPDAPEHPCGGAIQTPCREDRHEGGGHEGDEKEGADEEAGEEDAGDLEELEEAS